MASAGSQLLDKLGDAIAALDSPAFAERLSEFLKGCCSFDNIAVIAYRGEAKPIILHSAYRTATVYAWLDEYVEGAYLLDPFFRAHLARVPTGIYTLRDVAPDQFKRSAYYRSYYKKTTIVDEICALAYTAGGYSVQVSMGTDKSSGHPFSRRALASLKAYESVICSLLERNWRNLDARAGENGPTGGGDGSHADRLINQLRMSRDIELSMRQAEVALLILQGHSSTSIALRLGISPQTVKVHRKLLYARCRISSQAELFAMMLPIMAAFTQPPRQV